MANPLDVLAPNWMGDSLENIGVSSLTQNYGLGVAEATPVNAQAYEQRNEKSMTRDKLRTAKAREFGKTKETVGF